MSSQFNFNIQCILLMLFYDIVNYHVIFLFVCGGQSLRGYINRKNTDTRMVEMPLSVVFQPDSAVLDFTQSH